MHCFEMIGDLLCERWRIFFSSWHSFDKIKDLLPNFVSRWIFFWGSRVMSLFWKTICINNLVPLNFRLKHNALSIFSTCHNWIVWFCNNEIIIYQWANHDKNKINNATLKVALSSIFLSKNNVPVTYNLFISINFIICKF